MRAQKQTPKNADQILAITKAIPEVRNHLATVLFPTTKEDIVLQFEENGASAPALALAERIPGKVYGAPDEVMDEVSHVEGELVRKVRI